MLNTLKPLELRLKIWQYTFPNPRRVRLDLSVLSSPPPTKLPVTMFVNHESRTETLKHYIVVFPTDIFDFSSGPVTPPFCFNPSTDSLYYRAESAESDSMRASFPKWLDYLGSKLPGGLTSISYLCIIWGRCHLEFLRGINSAGDVGNSMLLLPGLREICVERFQQSSDRELVAQRLRDCLLEKRECFVSQTPPKIILEKAEA